MIGLLCPTCRGVLRSCGVLKGGFACERGHFWPVVDEVPVLVHQSLTDDQAETIKTFESKWGHDVEAAREERVRIANEWFFRRFRRSFDGPDGLRRFLSSGRKRRLLDAGCGLGNLTTLLADLAPRAEVWGADLSPAVRKVIRRPNMNLVQADIRCLPVEGDFDLIVSDGVLHHTDDTRAAMLAVASRLAPGGDFLFYVYKRKAPLREIADDLIRAHVGVMSFEKAMEVCETITDLGRQLREANVVIHLEKPIECLGIEAGDHDLQRLVYWHFLKCFWDDEGNQTASVLENFDWYHPRLAHRHTLAEVRSWLEDARLEEVHIDVSESGFSVHARRCQP